MIYSDKIGFAVSATNRCECLICSVCKLIYTRTEIQQLTGTTGTITSCTGLSIHRTTSCLMHIQYKILVPFNYPAASDLERLRKARTKHVSNLVQHIMIVRFHIHQAFLKYSRKPHLLVQHNHLGSIDYCSNLFRNPFSFPCLRTPDPEDTKCYQENGNSRYHWAVSL